jgi:hypothetical protein
MYFNEDVFRINDSWSEVFFIRVFGLPNARGVVTAEITYQDAFQTDLFFILDHANKLVQASLMPTLSG